MATILAPNSTVNIIPPASSITPPSSPSPSGLNSSTAVAPPPTSQPNLTPDTPAPSTTSSSSARPPAVPTTPPPSPPLSPPPTATPPPTSPPPSPPKSPSPSPRPPSSPPPSPPTSPPPRSSPPSPPSSSPPVVKSPPPAIPPPPQSSPPSPPATLPSPPPPTKSASPSPPTSNSPPPPPAEPPESSPPPPRLSPPSPPDSRPAPLPPSSSPSPPGSTSPPPPVPSSSSPPSHSPPAPRSNSSDGRTPPSSPLPSLPTEKPTEKPTARSTPSANAASTENHGITAGTVVAIGIFVGFLALCLLVLAVWFTQKRKRRGAGLTGGYVVPSPFASSQNSDSSFLRHQNSALLAGSASGNSFKHSLEPSGVGNSKSWFSYEELSTATNGFSAQNLLGEGGFGCVYKGFLADGREVAVKQLKIGGGQGEREFRAEVEIISRVHHRYLVSLVGYCISEHQRLLVYDYVPNDTLHYHLHGEDRPVMEWATRVKVAAGAARGIAYLHEDCHPRIIHRDIKSSNILLDNNFEARVADFGLAKLAADANTHVTTRVMGTFGYMAPEYASSGKLTEKSDVFSFGVVLLEIITGRKPVDASQPLGDESLVEWARPLLTQALESERFEELVDPRLENNYVISEMFRMIEAAAACARHQSSKRPRMSQVVRALDSINESSDLTNGMKPGQSEIFNSREQSAQIRMFQRMAFGSQEHSTDFFERSHSSWGSWS